MRPTGSQDKMEKDDRKQQEEYQVLKGNFAAGPKGLGDPDDMSLRRVESEILIAKRVKEKAHIKCCDVVKVFSACSKEQGVLMPALCRKEAAAMNKCLVSWYKDPQLHKEATEEYLRDRSEYRRTGISQKQKRKEAATF